MIRFLYTIVLGIVANSLFAQDFTAQWTGHYSYLQIKDLAESSTTVYGAATTAVFAYDIASGSTSKLSTVNGLSGENIATVYYSQNFKALFIGYENGLIEVVFDGDTDIFSAVDIVQKQTILDSEKRINHFVEYNDILYISTNFGIIEFDFDKLEFGDTFFIGPNNTTIEVAQTAVFEGAIYAASPDGGLFKANQAATNLIDAASWQVVLSGSYGAIQSFGGNLYAFDTSGMLLHYNGTTFVSGMSWTSSIQQIKSNDSYLTIALENEINTYNTSFELVSTIARSGESIGAVFSVATTVGDRMYAGTEGDGMFQMAFNENVNVTAIHPEGPLLNIPRALDVLDGELWVTYGQYNSVYAPTGDGRGVSHFSKSENSWTNIPFSALFGAVSITDVAINPMNPSQVYLGSYNSGLLEIEDDVPVTLYDHTNTGNPSQSTGEDRLETILTTARTVRILGFTYDRNGDLWFNNALIENTGVKKFSPLTKAISSVAMSPIIPSFENMRFSDIIVTQDNTLLLGGYLDGVVAHNPETNSYSKVTEGLEEMDVRAIALDANDQLWVGSTNGLRVLSAASSIFQQQSPVLNDIVVQEDGVNQQQLNGQFIWDIKVDGSNNKWIATAGSGVFHLSADGEETLAHFTKENSPLPSNIVQDITIDGSSGAVFFATAKGLVEFQGTATEAQDNLEQLRVFPNPVRPGYSNKITVDGLIKGANVKITDIEGNLVFETFSDGGSVQWDTWAFGKHRVASGVYIVMVTAEEQVETKVAKLMIVR